MSKDHRCNAAIQAAYTVLGELYPERRFPLGPVHDIIDAVLRVADEDRPAIAPPDLARLRVILGAVVRDKWVELAAEHPDPKPSWLTPWDELEDPFQREADMQIGVAVYRQVMLLADAAIRQKLVLIHGLDQRVHDVRGSEREYRTRLRAYLQQQLDQFDGKTADMPTPELVDNEPDITISEIVEGGFCAGWLEGNVWMGCEHPPHNSRAGALACAEIRLRQRTALGSRVAAARSAEAIDG